MTNNSLGRTLSARRASSSVSPWSGPIDAVPDSTTAPSCLFAVMRAGPWASNRERGADFFALDHHGREVTADAAAFEPALSPDERGERVELAEVRGGLDGSPGQSQTPGRVGVVDAAVAAVLLGGQHLGRVTGTDPSA